MSKRIAYLAAAAIAAAPMSAWAEDAAAIYAEKCARCHGDMARFVEKSICLTDTIPVLREGGEKLEAFLANHGRLRADEIATVCKGVTETLRMQPAK